MTQTTAPQTPAPQAPARSYRQDAILLAAIQTFSRYGYKRCTMEDIAQAAGISRAALYLHYKNKEDIFRSLAKSFFDEISVNLAAALATPKANPAEVLAYALAQKDGDFMEIILSSPHGAELMDASFSISADIAAEGEAMILKLLSDWMAGHEIPAELGSAAELAQTLLSALYGIKSSARDFASYRAQQTRLAQVFGRLLG